MKVSRTGRWLVLLALGAAAAACTDGSGGVVSASASGGHDAGGAGGSGGAGGQAVSVGGSGGGQVEPDGSWRNPYLIDSLPFSTEGSTDGVLTLQADSYFPCAPGTNEGGPEIVYQLTVTEPGWLWAQIDDVPGDMVDIDLHLLAAPSPDACVTRDDSLLGAPVLPGDYWLVADSWVDGEGTPLSGSFMLEVGFVGEGNLACLESPIECDGMLPPFVNLQLQEEPGDAGCVPGMARVDDFCIDRYEALVVRMGAQGWEPFSPYEHPADTDTLLALSVAGAIPQGHISQVQAADACMMAGKRLCTNTEWLRACQGAAATTYPYGDVLEPGRCNDARDCHPVPQLFESSDNWIWSELGHPCISQLPEGLAASGSYASCESAEGVFDMMGNLHEWTADPSGTFRGGFYVDTVINGPGCLYATTAHNVLHHDYSTGFRCCDEAMP